MFKREVTYIWKRSIYFQLKTQTSFKVISKPLAKAFLARELITRCYQIS